MHTSITLDVLDFENFTVEEKAHIGISVKDFKFIVMHAETLRATVTAQFSHPTRPMQLTYAVNGMQCEFTLMTIGDYRGGSVTPSPAVARNNSVAPGVQQTPREPPLMQADDRQVSNSSMPPPLQPASRIFTREPASQRLARPSPPPPKPSLDDESLFISMENDDERKWGEKNFDEDEDTLGWDPNLNNVGNEFKNLDAMLIGRQSLYSAGLRSIGSKDTMSLSDLPSREWTDSDDKALAPTQRISEVCGHFLLVLAVC